MRISRYSRTRKEGQRSREHDLVGESRTILITLSSVTVEKEANVGGGESGVICWKLVK